MSGNQRLDLLGELHRLEGLREPSRHGKRHFRRCLVRGTAELHPTDTYRLDRSPIEVQLRDVSRVGIGFVAAQPLPTNSSWRVCFTHRGHIVGDQTLLIRHCRVVQPGLYLVGGQFCIGNGLLSLLGVEPTDLGADSDSPDTEESSTFVPPGDVA